MSAHQQKRESAIAWMGERWILHPTRHVQRLKDGAQIDLHRCDVARTIAKYRKQQEKANLTQGE